MTLNKIWSAFIIIAILVASFKFMFSSNDGKFFNMMVTGKSGDSVLVRTHLQQNELAKFQLDSLQKNKKLTYQNFTYKLNDDKIQVIKIQKSTGIIQTAKDSVDICIGLVGIMTLFMGIMSIAEKAGGINLLSRLISPFFGKLFPEIPKGHASFGHMMMNFSANLLGLDNAATPFGLKAMESLQELNPNKTTASNAQIMFLCLHASGLTLIPVSIIAIRAAQNAQNPTDIFIPCMIATFVATITAMSIVALRQKINLFQPIILAWIGGASILIASLVLFLITLNASELELFSGNLSNGLILFIFIAIVLGAVYKKVEVFDAFVSGAKEGFYVAVKIIPYLVGMLVAISLLRTSGTFDFIIDGFKTLFSFLPDTRFVDGLPTAIIKPLSGSGARGMMVDTMQTFGVDSFAGRLSGILQGSSDTTFYVVAVYFGAIGIQNTRYTIGTMLLADLAGVITSILLAYLFFG